MVELRLISGTSEVPTTSDSPDAKLQIPITFLVHTLTNDTAHT